MVQSDHELEETKSSGEKWPCGRESGSRTGSAPFGNTATRHVHHRAAVLGMLGLRLQVGIRVRQSMV